MKNRVINITLALLLAGFLGGCASYGQANLNAPCPNYGASCHKTPINGWHH